MYLVAVLRGDSNIKGTVTFEQADENAQTTISWNISGHDANAERGMHVHAFGDNTNGCTSAGPHCTYSYSILHLHLYPETSISGDTRLSSPSSCKMQC